MIHAGAANALFDGMRSMDLKDLKALSRSDLKALFEERLDALVSAGKRKSDDLDAESSVPQVITNMLEATRELLSRPMPLADRTTRDRTATLRLLVELKTARDDGRFLVSAAVDDLLERLATDGLSGGPPHDNINRFEEVKNAAANSANVSPNKPVATGEEHLASKAFDNYAKDLRARKGDAGFADNVMLRKRMFVAVLGDLPLSQINNGVLRSFGYAISYLPAEVARRGSWDENNLLNILKNNGFRAPQDDGSPSPPGPIKQQTIGEQTLLNKILRPIQTALELYAADRRTELPLHRFSFQMPQHVPRSRTRTKASEDSVITLIKAGKEDGRLMQAMFPLLGAFVGRRLGLLAYLRAETLRDIGGGIYTMKVERRYFERGVQVIAPIKNDESEGAFVLHRFFVDCGFVDFVKSKKSGWVFESLHADGILHPESAAQKRMTQLRKAAGLTDTVFHQLRHFLIGKARASLLPEDIRKKQVGQKGDVHANYGDQWEPEEASLVANLPLPSSIALSIFNGFDFVRAERLCIATARKEQRRRSQI
jgi:integrase